MSMQGSAMMYGIVGFPSLPALNSGMLGSHYNCEVQRAPVNERRAPPPRCRMAERPLPTANAIVFNMTLGHGLLRRLYPTKPTRLAAASSSLLISRIAITYAQGTKISKPSCRLPVPSQLPSVLAKSPAGWPSSLSLPVTAKAGAPARWLRFGSSNCRLHGNFSNQGASTHELYPIIFPHPHIPSSLRCRP